MLWSQIIYGHGTTSILPKTVRLSAPGRRQEQPYDKSQVLDVCQVGGLAAQRPGGVKLAA